MTGELYENLLEHDNNTEQGGYARLLATISGSIESAGGYNVTPFPSNTLESICHTMNHFPMENHKSILLRAYPLALEDDRFHALMGNSQQNESQKVFWRSLDQTGSLQEGSFSYPVDTVSKMGPSEATVSFLGSEAISVKVPCGRGEPNTVSTRFVPTTGSKRVMTAMVQEHAVGRDILLISPKGEGKNATAQQFAGLLGYDTHLFGMYSELTSRDLLVRRTTDSTTGETSWEESPLITAARQGDICILDGIEKLRPDVLSSLQSLATDREASLPDGRRLARQENMASDSSDSKVIPVHPSFRIVALGSLTKDSGTRWLTADAMSMFSTLLLPSPTDIRAILKSVNPSCPPGVVDILLKFSKRLTYEVAEDCGVAPMSTRNLIRVVRRAEGDANLHNLVCSVLVADLLPPVQRASLESLMEEAGITGTKPSKRKKGQANTISIQDDTVTIGDFSMKQGAVKRPEMVPFPKFFDIPSHVNVIQDLLQDWSNGERALLLLGNQGVGKNMIVDRICQIGT
jgi:MoxR-like ATPase